MDNSFYVGTIIAVWGTVFALIAYMLYEATRPVKKPAPAEPKKMEHAETALLNLAPPAPVSDIPTKEEIEKVLKDLEEAEIMFKKKETPQFTYTLTTYDSAKPKPKRKYTKRKPKKKSSK